VHLVALLAPFQEQKAHEAWLANMRLQLKMEQSNLNPCVRYNGRRQIEERLMHKEEYEGFRDMLEGTRELLDELRTEMAENRAAPKLLGVLELNEALIQTIVGTITSTMTAFVASFAQGVVTDISESSGFVPTSEPTMSPTYAPTTI